MNVWLNIPLEFRLLLLGMIGAIGGAAVNFAAAALAWERRAISPWQSLTADELRRIVPRRWPDKIPIVGWFALSREAPLFGFGHWLRPLAVELFTTVALPLLYTWEVAEKHLWMVRAGPPTPAEFLLAGNVEAVAHAMFVCHAILLLLMAIATLTDISERVISDGITIPGTLFGLIACTIYPWSRLPGDLYVVRLGGVFQTLGIDFFKATSPRIGEWPNALGAYPHVVGLLIALAIYGLWIAALMRRPWRTRRGYRLALFILWMRFRQSFTPLAFVVLFGGWAGIAVTWFIGGAAWIGLMSALIGLAVGGGLVWIVRVAGTIVLGKEAMGFGDVTLMAMIGTLIGWQPCIIVFFLAPLFALAFGIVNLAMKRGGEIYYGPFLCLATAVVVVRWTDVWTGWAAPIFEHVWLVPMAMAVSMVGMVFLLAIVRSIRDRFFPEHESIQDNRAG